MASAHNFVREKSGDFCYFCKNFWKTSNSAIASFYSCQNCNLSAHGACKLAASQCLPCFAGARITTPAGPFEGKLELKLKQAVDIGSRHGTSIYGIWKLDTFSVRTEQSVATNNECVWTGDSFESVQSISARVTDSDGDKQVELELWTTYLGIFDQQIAKLSFSILPLVWHANVTIERWFDLSHGESKVLIQARFCPSKRASPRSSETAPRGTAAQPHTLLSESRPPLPRSSSSMRSSSWFSFSSLSAIETPSPPAVPSASSPPNEDAEETTTNPNERLLSESMHSGPDESVDALFSENAFGRKRSASSSSRPTTISMTSLQSTPRTPSARSSPSLAIESALPKTPHVVTLPPHPSDTLSHTTPSAATSTAAWKPVTGLSSWLFDIEGSSVAPADNDDEAEETEEKTRAGDREDKHAGSRPLHSLDLLDMGHLPTMDSYSNAPLSATDTRKFAGKLDIHVVAVTLSAALDISEGYLLLAVEDNGTVSSVSVQSHCVPCIGSAMDFDFRCTLPCPHFRSRISVKLMDAVSERCVGQTAVWPFQIIVRAADETVERRLDEAKTRWRLYSPQNEEEEVGYGVCHAAFEENTASLYSAPVPAKVLTSGEEDVSLERLQQHIQRFYNLIALFNESYQLYLDIMAWKDPILTSTLLLAFLYCTLVVHSDYLLSGVMFALVAFMTLMLVNRRTGRFRERLVCRGDPQIDLPYIPIAGLRISVLGFRHRNMALIRNPILRLSYYPSSPFPSVATAASAMASSASTKIISPRTHTTTTTTAAAAAAAAATHATAVAAASAFASSATPNATTRTTAANASSSTTPSYAAVVSSAPSSASSISSVSSSYSASATKNPSSATVAGANSKTLIAAHAPTPAAAGVSTLASPRAEEIDQRGALEEFIIGFLGMQGAGCSHSAAPSMFTPSFLRIDSSKGDHLLHNVVDLWPLDADAEHHMKTPCLAVPQPEACLLYPLLQPKLSSFPHLRPHVVPNTAPGAVDLQVYVPWELNEGVVKIVLAHDPAAALLQTDKEYLLLPIKALAQVSSRQRQPQAGAGDSMCWTGWMRCHDTLLQAAQADSFSSSTAQANPTNTEVLLRVSLTPPDACSTYVPTSLQNLQSTILQVALQDKVISSSPSTLSVLWKMKDYVKYVQNGLKGVADTVESWKNLCNWTLPNKTYPLYLLVLVVWLITIVMPGRYIILTIGLYQFFYVLLPIPDGDEYLIKLDNYLQSIPNDDDLMTIYRRERQAHARQRDEKHKAVTQSTLLGLTLTVRWMAVVELKSSSDRSQGSSPWQTVLLLLQGRRLVWYRSQQDLDDGKGCAGHLLLTRMASLTQASPVDLREKGDEKRMLSVFGQESGGKLLKVTVACATMQDRSTLEQHLRELLDSWR